MPLTPQKSCKRYIFERFLLWFDVFIQAPIIQTHSSPGSCSPLRTFLSETRLTLDREISSTRLSGNLACTAVRHNYHARWRARARTITARHWTWAPGTHNKSAKKEQITIKTWKFCKKIIQRQFKTEVSFMSHFGGQSMRLHDVTILSSFSKPVQYHSSTSTAPSRRHTTSRNCVPTFPHEALQVVRPP